MMFKTIRHGHARSKSNAESRTYKAWASMKQRCSNPKASGWKRYGGRGIRFDPNWEEFESFLSDMGECPEGMSLDRIDNDGYYEKDNCQWATPKEQANNRKHPAVKYPITLNGETKALSLWCKELGVKYHTALWRYHKGWPLEEIFNERYVSYHT